jgi:hypothetical protein
VGQPDALLRAAPVPNGQGPAHRVRGRQPVGAARRHGHRDAGPGRDPR